MERCIDHITAVVRNTHTHTQFLRFYVE